MQAIKSSKYFPAVPGVSFIGLSSVFQYTSFSPCAQSFHSVHAFPSSQALSFYSKSYRSVGEVSPPNSFLFNIPFLIKLRSCHLISPAGDTKDVHKVEGMSFNNDPQNPSFLLLFISRHSIIPSLSQSHAWNNYKNYSLSTTHYVFFLRLRFAS